MANTNDKTAIENFIKISEIVLNIVKIDGDSKINLENAKALAGVR